MNGTVVFGDSGSCREGSFEKSLFIYYGHVSVDREAQVPLARALHASRQGLSYGIPGLYDPLTAWNILSDYTFHLMHKSDSMCDGRKAHSDRFHVVLSVRNELPIIQISGICRSNPSYHHSLAYSSA